MARTSTEFGAVGLIWAALAALRLAFPAPVAPGPLAPVPAGAVFTLGVPERGATLAWWQVGRQWASGAPLGPEVLVATIHRIGAADATWRTPWIYGGLMLQASDTSQAATAAEALLEEGATRWPDDPWFPAALGVHLQDHGQVEAARRWLREARERS